MGNPEVGRGSWRRAAAVLALLAGAPAAGDVVYVDDDAPPGGDGVSRATALNTINDALAIVAPGDEIEVAPGTYVETIDFAGLAVILRSSDGPLVTTVDGAGAGPVVTCATGEGATTVLEGFTVTGGAGVLGGGMYINGASPTVTDCRFVGNSTTSNGKGGGVFCRDGSPAVTGCLFSSNSSGIGGGLITEGSGGAELRQCEFAENSAPAGAGLAVLDGPIGIVVGCVFRDHDAGLGAGGGVAVAAAAAAFVNCEFTQNEAAVGGGLYQGSMSAGVILVNCSFRGNCAGIGAGLYFTEGTTLTNCTIASNSGAGVMYGLNAVVVATNCIVWGNSAGQVVADPQLPGGTAIVQYCDVQGGWTGSGGFNIDADPQFVQPGTGNLRLAFGSACLEAGNAASLPLDTFDADGDGDTAEILPIDHAGGPRVLGREVDMGAFEGDHAPLPPAVSEDNLDQGLPVVLVPTGAPFQPIQTSAVIATNLTGPDDSTMLVTQYDTDLHPPAGGYAELGDILCVATSLAAGEMLMTVYISFDLATIGGADPFTLDLASYDPVDERWRLAVLGNTQDSPGHSGPVGDRTATGGGVTGDLGDYGVVVNPLLQRGFVWANVDYAGDFGFGYRLCPPDCAPPAGDDVVDGLDVVAIILAWGTPGTGACDTNLDGIVDGVDLVNAILAWGSCE